MNPRDIRRVPNSITFCGPNLSMNQPTKGDITPVSVRCRDMAAEVVALLQPNCSTIGSKNAPKPCQKVPEVYA